MNYSARLQRDYQRLIRQRGGFEQRVETELKNSIEAYRARFSARHGRGEKPVAILAEGDSWFRYGVGFAVIYHLERLLGTEILNLAKPGDEARKMLTGKQAKRLTRELKRGPSPRIKYQFLLFSGGGNDLVGEDTFYKWLHDYQKGMSAKDMINTETLSTALRLLRCDYENLIAIRDAVSPNTQLLLHGYDFAYPDGRGVCWFGPWLKPGLDQRKAPRSLSFRTEVVGLFLKRFDAMLKRISRRHKNVYVVPTQGTLGSKSQWDNELHPSKGGFKKIAKKFESVIAAAS